MENRKINLRAVWVCLLFISGAWTLETAQTTDTIPKQVAPGEFELGLVRFWPSNQIVRFPASVNMSTGLVEYLCVNGIGKLHESVLKTETEPLHLHLSRLLASGKETKDLSHHALVYLEWMQNGKTNKIPAEKVVLDKETGALMEPGPWVYAGSRVVNGVFLAQRDGSVIAIMKDIDALLDNPRPRSTNDENWEVIGSNLPPVGASLTVELQFIKPAP